MRKTLSDAEWRILAELMEPNQNADHCWFFPTKNLRTLRSLAHRGLAKHIDSDARRHGYAITLAGKEKLAEYGKR